MQLELFTMEQDDRVKKMRGWIRLNLVNNKFWFPSARELVEIGDEYGIVGALPLHVFEEEAKRYCTHLESVADDIREENIERYCNYFDNSAIGYEELDEEEGYDIINFYRKRLKKKRN